MRVSWSAAMLIIVAVQAADLRAQCSGCEMKSIAWTQPFWMGMPSQHPNFAIAFTPGGDTIGGYCLWDYPECIPIWCFFQTGIIHAVRGASAVTAKPEVKR